jgi:predicted transcriptional regulator
LISEADVINAISDARSLELFKAIAQTNSNSDTFRKKIRLTRKQYYSRMSRMTRVGLIKRKNGKYFLTSLGKVVYQAEAMIEGALNDYWKLKAIDSLETSINSAGLPDEERKKILDTLIDNRHIKEILLPQATR